MWGFVIFSGREHFTLERLQYSLFCIQFTFLCKTGWIFCLFLTVFLKSFKIKCKPLQTLDQYTEHTPPVYLIVVDWNQTLVLSGRCTEDASLRGGKNKVNINLRKENFAKSKQMLICLLSGDAKPDPTSVSIDAAMGKARKIKHRCATYTFTFYSLCSEIAGSIISLITLLDMMHQNLSFTGIHWIEDKVSQWIHDWQFCPLHLQQWMTVSRYFVFLFFFGCSLFF